MKLQITNIERTLTEEDLNKIFSKYGSLKSCDLIMDAKTGKSKGFGFVTIQDEEIAREVVKQLNGRVINGEKIKVKIVF